MLALIILNTEMNKRRRKDLPPHCLNSNDEGKREDIYLNLNNNVYIGGNIYQRKIKQ